MAIQIGNYKRPGIFLEEVDNSIISSPTLEGITTLLIGFSKKGPVNTPVLVQNKQDMRMIFGDIDRSLERKGSFFNRTLDKMLESSPVYVLNLLLTDDNLDKVKYKSISLSTGLFNEETKEGAYRRFFDTTGFWKKDTESFLNLTKNDNGTFDNRLLSIVNLSDKPITTFIIKSKLNGFDRTLVEWYGSVEKLPAYVDGNDWASDYLVDVVVVAGDWTNYEQLSVDPRWSQYFNNNGLKKDRLNNFYNDRNVTSLKYYEGVSLIPYFRGLDGTNIFIETVINRDTDMTGLFCAFNTDLFETDFRNGLVDLNASSLVGTTQSSIDFMSYKTNITESTQYDQVLLDRPGNVVGIGSLLDLLIVEPNDPNERSGWFMDEFTFGLSRNPMTYSTNNIVIEYETEPVNGTINPYFVRNGVEYQLPISISTFNIATASYTTPGTYKSTIIIDSNNEISKIDSFNVNSTTNPAVTATDIVLGYVEFDIDINGLIDNVQFTDVTVDETDFVQLVNGVDYQITNVGTTASSILRFEMLNTALSISINQYEQFRKVKLFNRIINTIDSVNVGRSVMISNKTTHEKVSLSTMNVDNIQTSSLVNKSFDLATNLPESLLTDVITDGYFVVYKVDDETIFGSTGLETRSGKFNSLDAFGIVAKYSTLYTDYINGKINTRDYFVAQSGGFDTNIYLQKYLDGETLYITFKNEDFTGDQILDGFVDNITIVSNISNYKQTLEIEVPVGYTQVSNKILVKSSRYTEIKVGDFLDADTSSNTNAELSFVPKKITRILTKRVYTNDTSLVEITCDGPILKLDINGDLQTTRYTKIDDYVTSYNGIVLDGFRVRTNSLPDGTEARQNAILNLVSKGTPLFKAITNKEAIEFRYLVDSFGLGLTELSKQQLVDICGERLDCFGFINMPSMKQFKNSNNPSFVNNEGVLQLEFVAQGGDPESNPAFLYSFGEGRGTTCSGYFLPYVTVNDNGRPTDVPPAAYVATTYMRKHNSNVSTTTPWTISAGVTDGRVTGIANLEEDFSPTDIEFLDQSQMNPIVFKRNRGFVIETENTAQTLFKSALSNIHVREVLIELEKELAAMLLNFQWKYNTPETRAEIKLRADVICERYVNRKGLFNYFNKCDEENNTNELISNQIGLLSTYVEPIMGLKILVNEITILRTGSIQSGGFTFA